MKTSFGVLALGVGLGIGASALGDLPTAMAQSSYYFAGQAVSGELLLVDLDSIRRVGNRDANFDYVLSEALVEGQAHCVGGGAWTTLNDGVTHYAQSQATREMLRIVCSYSGHAPIEIAVEPAPTDDLPADLSASLPVPGADLPAPQASSTQVALVYDPSSNVRATPNGQILCSIDTRAYIN
ncbi:MAG: hypothetical protein AAF528_13755, partial [Cyanobacteria bacterium P01_C01_bin.121]